MYWIGNGSFEKIQTILNILEEGKILFEDNVISRVDIVRIIVTLRGEGELVFSRILMILKFSFNENQNRKCA